MNKLSAGFFITAFLFLGHAGAADQDEKARAGKKKAEVIEEKASAQGGEASPGPGGKITKGEAQAVDPAGKEPLEEAITCLARTIYWEARGEDEASMQAVANVVMNRLGHEGFPDTICGVVKQGREQGSCQFSWWCDGRPDQAQNEVEYARAKEVARKVLNGELKDRTDGATYFHNRKVRPAWAVKYIKTATVGEHIFYKPEGGKAK